MKDLSQMVKGINRNNITEHQEKPVIDEFAKGIINRVFDNFLVVVFLLAGALPHLKT